MTESTVRYITTRMDGADIKLPVTLHKFLLRMASLERGRAYNITLMLPGERESEPVWTVLPLGKIENLR